MPSVQVLLAVATVLLAAEGLLRAMVHRARSRFPWLVLARDEFPVLDAEKLDAYLRGSFSPELGWAPVPGSTGEDRTGGAVVTFRIGPDGARAPAAGAPAPTAAAFGDSYAFARQVADDETWESVLGLEHGIGVMNFGVGNYGVDQALLRYRATALPDSVRAVVMVFVPETIARIQSVWKHWMEFGNTFAFKPRFVLDGAGGIRLVPNPVEGRAAFDDLRATAASIGDLDPHRRERFARLRFRTPYLAALTRAPRRHLGVLAAVLGGGSPLTQDAFDTAFARIMRHNVRAAHTAYLDVGATRLLDAVLAAFVADSRARGHRPVVCVIPQLMDLREARSADRTYRPYFAGLASRLDAEVVDATAALRAQGPSGLYVHDRYGGHLSPAGNRLVADLLAGSLR